MYNLPDVFRVKCCFLRRKNWRRCRGDEEPVICLCALSVKCKTVSPGGEFGEVTIEREGKIRLVYMYRCSDGWSVQ